MTAHLAFTDLPTAHLLTLLAEHHGRVKQRLPWIRTMASKVAQVHGPRDSELLELDRLVRELDAAAPAHLELEEEGVFASLTDGAAAPACRADDLVTMTEEHLAIGELLEAIRVAASDFRVPEWACVTYRKLMTELRALEADLLACIQIEGHELARRMLQPRAQGPA